MNNEKKGGKKITFQWHVTEQCNYRCTHCYQEGFSNEGLSYSGLIEVLNKLDDFVVKSSLHTKNPKAHINFTGGEPFLRKDIIGLLSETVKRGYFTFGILSNGYLLNEEGIGKLKDLKPQFVQISLEGNKEINDSIRGTGSFDEIIRAIKTYNKFKIPVMLSFTANAKNYKYFGEVVKVARKYKVYKVWADRYLPINNTDGLELSTEQTRDFFNIILSEQRKNKHYIFSKTKITSNRALQFLVTGGAPYTCSAAKSLFAILANGDVLPCRRMPVKIGNLINDDLGSIIQSSKVVKELNSHETIKECRNCYYKKTCNGGLKCLSYSKYGSALAKDPNCWI